MRKSNTPPTWEELVYRSVPEPNSGCLLWLGAVSSKGYGQIRFYDRISFVHRLAYELWNGAIPDGCMVLHTCDQPSCLEPRHLRLGSPLENMVDKCLKGRDNRPGRYRRGAVLTPSGRWAAYGAKDGKHVHLGTFDSEEDAFKAATAYRLRYWSEKCPALYRDGVSCR